MKNLIGLGATRFHKYLQPTNFDRLEPGPGDVELQLLYCGICHSDIHQIRNDWKNTVYPCVPGHEIVGRVSRIGDGVTQLQVGDLAAVGCMVDSCGDCPSCRAGDEQYCESESSWLATYNGPMQPNGQNTFGGYSNYLVARERFVLKLPEGLEPELAGPILCAGVTTYSPLKHFGVKAGMRVGIAGFGGLGHMATQIAKAMGAEVTVITTTPEKSADAKRLGASRVLIAGSHDKKQKERMEASAKSLDLILNTIPYEHEMDPYLELLHRDGIMVVVGLLIPIPKWSPKSLIMGRKTIAGSVIGSIAETREVLDFCVEHGIRPLVEKIPVTEVSASHEKVVNKQARYRYVIDPSTLDQFADAKLDHLGLVGHRLRRAGEGARPAEPAMPGLTTRAMPEIRWETGQQAK